jgi:hypothetical protein
MIPLQFQGTEEEEVYSPTTRFILVAKVPLKRSVDFVLAPLPLSLAKHICVRVLTCDDSIYHCVTKELSFSYEVWASSPAKWMSRSPEQIQVVGNARPKF